MKKSKVISVRLPISTLEKLRIMYPGQSWPACIIQATNDAEKWVNRNDLLFIVDELDKLRKNK